MPKFIESVFRANCGISLEAIGGGFRVSFADNLAYQRFIASAQEAIRSAIRNPSRGGDVFPEIAGVENFIQFPPSGVIFTLEPAGNMVQKTKICDEIWGLVLPLAGEVDAQVLPKEDTMEVECPTFPSFALFMHLFSGKY